MKLLQCVLCETTTFALCLLFWEIAVSVDQWQQGSMASPLYAWPPIFFSFWIPHMDCKENLLSMSKTEKIVSHLDRKLSLRQPWTVFSVCVCNSDGVYEKDKERLANMMAFGQDIVPSSSETSKVVRRPQKPEAESDEEIDRFQERKKPLRYMNCRHHNSLS